MSEVTKQNLVAAKQLIRSLMVARPSKLYEHMIKAVDGYPVPWFSDACLIEYAEIHGSFEIVLYRLLRENRDALLNPESMFMEMSGAVQVYWLSGGSSEAVIYQDREGTKMLCCANWVSGPVSLASILDSIKKIKKIGPVA